ncbi:mechanosensitive ion channel domain-containing protein [Teichococcus vastitatis]|uniref:Mechanosensitive ion channel n=1 Tax=Teichococcus vastitatis TaxID=2307076 RepID=A0ABS9W155_9PROT|nr:mechanosensitive ion channel domain-containing protein [Pseudoroseomonas vastitatis]MCI0752921.1 mechanosensitive ion channel [Pseudoroseomonas vastitatis]
MAAPKHLILLFLAGLMWGSAPPAVLAQLPGATSQATPAPAQPDPVAALDGILGTLRSDAERAAFVRQLEQLRNSLAQQRGGTGAAASPGGAASGAGSPGADNPGVADPAATDDVPPQEGLLGAVAAGLTDIGQTVRQQVEGGTVQGRFVAAARQISGRLGAAWSSGAMLDFILWAGAGWVLAAAALYGLSRLRWLRPRPDAQRFHLDHRSNLFRSAGLELLRRLIPLGVAAAVIFAWPAVLPRGWQEARLFLAVATPLLVGALVWRTGFPLLFLLGPLRGWQITRYARRRVLPWLAALATLALFSSSLRDPDLRWIIGPDVALLLAFTLDIVLGVVALLFIIRRRRAVQRLLVESRAEGDQRKGVLHSVATQIAANWHLLGIALVAGHLITRFFGLGQGSFFGRAMLTLGAIALIMAVTFTISGGIARLVAHLDSGRGGLVRRLQWRLLGVLRLLLRVAGVIAMVVVGLQIWNIDVLAWASRGIGLAIVRPLGAIAVAVLVGWVLWVLVDSAVEHALATPPSGAARDHSTRARTLLPMLRNFAFVVLCALTVIAIMSNLGINVAPLLAGAGVIGLAISFGSQQLVQDVITGLFMLIEDTIGIGDTIDTGDRAGVVESVTIRTVRVRDGEGALHTIPFSQIKALKNRSRGFGVYTVKVVVGYDADLDRAMTIMNEVGEELQRDPEFAGNMMGGLSIWGVDQFTPEGITIMGGLRTRALQQWGVGRAFNLRLKQRFDAEGIALTPPRPTMMVPARGAWPEPEAGPESGTEARHPA